MSPCTPLLRIDELAVRLRVSVSWLRAEAEAGRLPLLRAGDVDLFDFETIERILRERAAKERLVENVR